MNIGIVCYPTYGGSGVVATELGKYLADKGHQLHFLSYELPARLDYFSNNVFYHEVSVNQYPLFRYPPYELALTSKMVDLVLSTHIDLLHVHYAIPHAAAAVMAKHILRSKNTDVPVITTLHGTDITLVGRDSTYTPVVNYALDNSDGITAVSNSLKQDTYTHFQVKSDIEVIPNFVDFSRFSKQPKEHFKKAIAPNNERIVIHTSNFRKVKRVQDVIQVFARIQKEIPARLLLIGDGPERLKMEEICRELNITELVSFLGKQEAVEEVLSVGDLFLLPSETESFGLAALEAMACEVPVVASNTGGIPEVIPEGLVGFTCDVGDVETMAKRGIEILKDPDELNRFKQEAKKHARSYDIEVIGPMYEKYYDKIVAGFKR